MLHVESIYFLPDLRTFDNENLADVVSIKLYAYCLHTDIESENVEIHKHSNNNVSAIKH